MNQTAEIVIKHMLEKYDIDVNPLLLIPEGTSPEDEDKVVAASIERIVLSHDLGRDGELEPESVNNSSELDSIFHQLGLQAFFREMEAIFEKNYGVTIENIGKTLAQGKYGETPIKPADMGNALLESLRDSLEGLIPNNSKLRAYINEAGSPYEKGQELGKEKFLQDIMPAGIKGLEAELGITIEGSETLFAPVPMHEPNRPFKELLEQVREGYRTGYEGGVVIVTPNTPKNGEFVPLNLGYERGKAKFVVDVLPQLVNELSLEVGMELSHPEVFTPVNMGNIHYTHEDTVNMFRGGVSVVGNEGNPLPKNDPDGIPGYGEGELSPRKYGHDLATLKFNNEVLPGLVQNLVDELEIGEGDLLHEKEFLFALYSTTENQWSSAFLIQVYKEGYLEGLEGKTMTSKNSDVHNDIGHIKKLGHDAGYTRYFDETLAPRIKELESEYEITIVDQRALFAPALLDEENPSSELLNSEKMFDTFEGGLIIGSKGIPHAPGQTMSVSNEFGNPYQLGHWYGAMKRIEDKQNTTPNTQ